MSALIAPSQSPAPIARLPAAKSGSSAAQSGVSTIAAMVEQIGHASVALVIPDTALSGLASVAVRPWWAGAAKKYETSTVVSTPATAAMRIERIMIVVPSVGCRTARPVNRSLIVSSAVHCCIKEDLASLISTRSVSAPLVISASFRK